MSIRIYKITSAQTPSVYIGSTKEPIARRLNGHRRSFKLFQAGGRSSMSSFEIVKHDDAQIELIREIEDGQDRDDEEHRAQEEQGTHCINIRDPRVYKTTKPPHNLDYVFTAQETERINNSPTNNGKYVLRNYYRNRKEKLKLCHLRRTRQTGKSPKESTLQNLGITPAELAEAQAVSEK
jgi:hypothetical protein